MMTMIIKKSNKSLQNSLNDMQLELGEEVSISNSAYTQARAKLNYTAFIEMKDKSVEMFYEDGEYNRYKHFRLLAVDGSIVILPNSADIKKVTIAIKDKDGKIITKLYTYKFNKQDIKLK